MTNNFINLRNKITLVDVFTIFFYFYSDLLKKSKFLRILKNKYQKFIVQTHCYLKRSNTRRIKKKKNSRIRILFKQNFIT